jgi:hypothetical protein
MRLTSLDAELLGGSRGRAVGEALRSQMAVGEFFEAEGFTEITQAHIAVDYEVMGEPGLRLLREIAAEGVRVAVPTTRNARSVCPPLAEQFRQDKRLVEAEARVSELLVELGVAVVNTCVPYEVAYTPAFGERVAWGDTGAAAFANGVLGARTNFEGGIAGLWAALTGRVPAFGFQLTEARRATAVCRVSASLASRTDWAVLGAVVGERLRGYDNVPFIDVDGATPSRDSLKGLAAALASYGSIAMFHVGGVTPEARSIEEATGDRTPSKQVVVTQSDIETFYSRGSTEAMPEVVVFTAPQLSSEEITSLADQVGERGFHPRVTVIITTSPATRSLLADSAIARLEAAGATVVDGTCWYLMDLARMRTQFGWRRVLTDSPKLANIVPASGLAAVVRPTQQCIEAAISGRLAT